MTRIIGSLHVTTKKRGRVNHHSCQFNKAAPRKLARRLVSKNTSY